MITTNDQHEVKPFPFMRTPGFKSWRTAGLDVWKTYFLMSFACKEGRVWVSQGMVLWCEQDLLGFCEQARESAAIRIYQITKLVPPEADHVEMWTPTPIKEIWRAREGTQDDELMFIAGVEGQPSISASDRRKMRRMEKIFDAG
jgi:hypothetical protein